MVFDLDFGFVVNTRVATSEIVAVVGRNLMLLNTVEAVYKVVFPYDFVPYEMDWRQFLSQVDDGRPLTEKETQYLETYRLAEDVGIEIKSKRNEFVVITAVAKVGLDLERFSAGKRSIGNGDAGPVSLRSDGAIIIVLPPVTVTEVMIDDSSSAEYEYPDVPITPDGWKRISAYVSASVTDRIAASGLFEEAKSEAKRFLRLFFGEAGYDSVIFK